MVSFLKRSSSRSRAIMVLILNLQIAFLKLSSVYSRASSKAMALQIELDRKRAKLKAHYDLAKTKAHAEARPQVEEARLDAEERLITLSKCGSSVAPSHRQGFVSSSGQSGGPSAGFKSYRDTLPSVVRRHDPRVSVEAARLFFGQTR